ncbi:hypothetical protein DFH29DRAFT_959888 [Suillus ampliporus]|nr:hypothetical protein DFH29DRAFT_959888 [Suillus ampliporus]
MQCSQLIYHAFYHGAKPFFIWCISCTAHLSNLFLLPFELLVSSFFSSLFIPSFSVGHGLLFEFFSYLFICLFLVLSLSVGHGSLFELEVMLNYTTEHPAMCYYYVGYLFSSLAPCSCTSTLHLSSFQAIPGYQHDQQGTLE